MTWHSKAKQSNQSINRSMDPSWPAVAYTDLHQVQKQVVSSNNNVCPGSKEETGQMLMLHCAFCKAFRRQHCIALH